LAYEASDAGLLSPELDAGVGRVKGAKKHGVRLGNWLTSEQGERLLAAFDRGTVRGKRDYAMIAVLPGCGLRRAELAALPSNTFNNERNTGFSLIWPAREVISARFRYRHGWLRGCSRG
jgi:integrase